MRTRDVFADQSVVDVVFRFKLHQKEVFEVYIRHFFTKKLTWNCIGILYTIRVKPVASVLADKALLIIIVSC